MSVQERILAIRLLKKQEKNPEYTKHLGVQVNMVKKETENGEKRPLSSATGDAKQKPEMEIKNHDE